MVFLTNLLTLGTPSFFCTFFFLDIVESYASDPLGLRFIGYIFLLSYFFILSFLLYIDFLFLSLARSNDTDLTESSPGVLHGTAFCTQFHSLLTLISLIFYCVFF